MAENIFDIHKHYRDTVERDQWDLIDPIIWDSGSQNDFIVSADAGTPKWYVYVAELRILDRSLSGTFTTPDAGFFDIIFPDYKGATDITKNIKSIDDLSLLAGVDIVTIGSNTLYVVKFKPKIILDPTVAKYVFTISKDANLTAISSGSLIFRVKGWRMQEADYLT